MDIAYQRERKQLLQSLNLRGFDGAVAFFSGPMDQDWRISLQVAPVHAGFYKIRTSTWGFRWDKGQVAPPPRKESFMLSVLLPEPGLRHRHSHRLGMFDNTSLDSRVHEITRWLEIDEELVFEVGSLTGFAPKTGRWASSEPGSATNYSGPGVALDWYEVEGPLFERWPPPSHRALFGDLPLLPFDPASGRRPPDRNPVKQIAIQARPSNDELSKEE